MNDSLVASACPTVPSDVLEFAVEKEVSRYLNAVIELAQQAFPTSALFVSLEQDAEDEAHRYIALDIDGGQTAEELLAGQRTWTIGISRICPSHQAVYFVLGWR